MKETFAEIRKGKKTPHEVKDTYKDFHLVKAVESIIMQINKEHQWILKRNRRLTKHSKPSFNKYIQFINQIKSLFIWKRN